MSTIIYYNLMLLIAISLVFIWLGNPISFFADRHRSLHSYITNFSEYLEDFAFRIDAPRLSDLSTTAFSELASVFDAPELVECTSHTLRFAAPHEARLVFDDNTLKVILLSTWLRGQYSLDPGWIFYIHFPLWRIFTDLAYLRHALRLPCTVLFEKEWQ